MTARLYNSVSDYVSLFYLFWETLLLVSRDPGYDYILLIQKANHRLFKLCKPRSSTQEVQNNKRKPERLGRRGRGRGRRR